MKEAVQHNEMVKTTRRRIKKYPSTTSISTTSQSINGTASVNDVLLGDAVSEPTAMTTPKKIEEFDSIEKINALNALNKLSDLKIGKKASKDAFMAQWLDLAFNSWVNETISKIFGSTNTPNAPFTKEEIDTLKLVVANIKHKATQPKPQTEVAYPANKYRPTPTPLREAVDTKGLENANHALLRELAKMDQQYDPDQ